MGKRYTKKYKYTGEFKNNMKHGKGKYEWIANDNSKVIFMLVNIKMTKDMAMEKQHGQMVRNMLGNILNGRRIRSLYIF